MLPNFFIVGALKAGTTSLADWLRDHPEAFVPRLKEPRYFAFDAGDPGFLAKPKHIYPVRTRDEYERLYEGASECAAIGDASPQYLYSEYACASINRAVPDARVVISLRHPVKRAYSQYWMRERAGLRNAPFVEAIRDREDWTKQSLYAAHVRRYLDVFGPERVIIVIFEDLIQAPSRELGRLCRFLRISDQDVERPLPKENAGTGRGIPFLQSIGQSRMLRLMLRGIVPQAAGRAASAMLSKGKPIPPLTQQAMAECLPAFLDDIGQTSELLGRDLHLVWGP